MNHHSRIDALAVKLSWTNFAIIGYEVKVARSDFLRDEKWRAYLPMCNQLYFAVAPGVCDPSEVPECCGLVTVTQSGNLRTVRKALARHRTAGRNVQVSNAWLAWKPSTRAGRTRSTPTTTASSGAILSADPRT